MLRARKEGLVHWNHRRSSLLPPLGPLGSRVRWMRAGGRHHALEAREPMLWVQQGLAFLLLPSELLILHPLPQHQLRRLHVGEAPLSSDLLRLLVRDPVFVLHHRRVILLLVLLLGRRLVGLSLPSLLLSLLPAVSLPLNPRMPVEHRKLRFRDLKRSDPLLMDRRKIPKRAPCSSFPFSLSMYHNLIGALKLGPALLVLQELVDDGLQLAPRRTSIPLILHHLRQLRYPPLDFFRILSPLPRLPCAFPCSLLQLLNASYIF
mmetsp:Transcript_18295/g.41624  ORF Transcript_18295/g.41624 Transcript_18295/m.41624 type:complete len:262 (+) Transcript_18295:1604-2389(+)